MVTIDLAVVVFMGKDSLINHLSYIAPWREPGTPLDQREYPFFTRLFGTKSSTSGDRGYTYIQDEENGYGERQPGLPKVSRDCLIAEIKCYGKYILPTLLVFVVLVLVVALGVFYHFKD